MNLKSNCRSSQGNPDILGIPAIAEIHRDYLPVLFDFERFTSENETWEVYYQIYRDIYREIALTNIANISFSASMQDFRESPADMLLDDFLFQVTQNHKLLLMFDEFDNLIRFKGEEKGLFGFIRELIATKHGDKISCIFVGADELVGMMKTRTKRLYSIAGTPIEIQYLYSEEARQLITEPMKKVEPNFEWAEGAIQRIIYLTAGNPYYIQMLCDRIVNNLIAGKRLRATSIDVEQGVREAVDHIGDLADIVDNLESINEKIVLTCIVNLTQHEQMERIWVKIGEIGERIDKESHNFPKNEIPGILRSLQSRYILDQRKSEETEMEYSIRVPLLRIYIDNYLKLKDVLREGGYII